MSQPQDPGKIEVNDRLCALVDVLLGLSTGALVLPTVFLRSFLGVPETRPLVPLFAPVRIRSRCRFFGRDSPRASIPLHVREVGQARLVFGSWSSPFSPL